MLFGKNNNKAKAIKLIEAAIEETENKSDRAYATGLIEMAYELEVITMNERAEYKEVLYSKELN